MQSTTSPIRSTSTWWIDILFLSVFLSILMFTLLGSRPLFVPDEGRYAEIAREMVVSGDYVTPYLNGIKYFEKPILFYWLGAAAIKVGGLNLWSLRTINALLSVIGCLLTYFTARKLYDRITGLLAALILGTSGLYFMMAHMISLDLPVTVFLAACLYAFLLGSLQTTTSAIRFYIWCSAAAAAFAVLTKGLIGMVFPSMIILAWIAICRDWRLLKKLPLVSALLIFLLITVPWHILVTQRNPEFFYFYFIEQQFLRYTNASIGHYEPVWYFIPTLMIGFFPWIVCLPQTLSSTVLLLGKRGQENKINLFFLLWATLVFTFFSFSKSKLIPYIVIIFPPLAILTARYLAIALQQNRKGRLRTSIAYIIPITIATAWLFMLLLNAALPALDTRTIRPLAQILRRVLQPEDDVVTYNVYYQDLPFYLERRVTILNWKNELEYGMKHQDRHEWMINDTTFWQRWHSTRRVFVLMGKDEFAAVHKKYPLERFNLLGETLTNVLVSNEKT